MVICGARGTDGLSLAGDLVLEETGDRYRDHL